MVSVKIYLHERYKSKNGTYPIILLLRNGNQRREISIDKIEKKYWKDGRVIKHPDAALINQKISEIKSKVDNYLAFCRLNKRPIHLDLADKEHVSYSFCKYLLHRAGQYAEKEMIIMEAKTKRLEKELRAAFGREVYFDDITQDSLRDLESWQIKKGNVENTRYKKFKFLGGFYKQALEDGQAEGPNPFIKYKIVTKPTSKEKLTTEEIKEIEALTLKGPVIDARNLFLFSYYCKGARFENCIMAKREQVINGRIMFRSNKGNKFISVKIHDRLQAILDAYQGEFIFPYVKDVPTDKKEYKRLVDIFNTLVNRHLKMVAIFAGVKKNITFHVARHTFAYHLKQSSGNIAVIQDSLGHSRSQTTEIYLKSLDDEHLDKEMDKLYGV